MFFKYKTNKDIRNVENEKRTQYQKAIRTAKMYIEFDQHSIEEKKILLNYMMDVIKRDIQSEYIADLFYHDESKTIEYEFVPFMYYDKDGTKHNIEISKTQEISLKDNYVITFPWDRWRMYDNIINIVKNGFKNDTNNHKVYYYEELDMCQVINGNHSIATGIYTQNGTVLAKVISMKHLFENLKTDGAYFYSIHDNREIEKVKDFRIAVLFEISKMKYELEKKP